MGIALLLIGLAVAIYVMLQFRAAESTLAVAEENSDHLAQQIKHKHNASETTQPTPEQLKEVKLANEVLEQLALPWGALFKTLESSNTDKVALLSIQPNLGKHSIKMSGEAKDFTALLDYIKQLEKSKSITGVALQTHEINVQTAEKPVSFTLSANWRPQP
jgi:Tfp pilus assembly protein PilN